MIARLRVAHSLGLELRTTGIVVAEVWRDASDDTSVRDKRSGLHNRQL
jgi:hypothetical protein